NIAHWTDSRALYFRQGLLRAAAPWAIPSVRPVVSVMHSWRVLINQRQASFAHQQVLPYRCRWRQFTRLNVLAPTVVPHVPAKRADTAPTCIFARQQPALGYRIGGITHQHDRFVRAIAIQVRQPDGALP